MNPTVENIKILNLALDYLSKNFPNYEEDFLFEDFSLKKYMSHNRRFDGCIISIEDNHQKYMEDERFISGFSPRGNYINIFSHHNFIINDVTFMIRCEGFACDYFLKNRKDEPEIRVSKILKNFHYDDKSKDMSKSWNIETIKFFLDLRKFFEFDKIIEAVNQFPDFIANEVKDRLLFEKDENEFCSI